MDRWRAAMLGGLLAMTGVVVQAQATELGETLMADVRRFDSFGLHRYGSPGLDGALDWIAGRLGAAGLQVAAQRFTLARQYQLDSGTLRAGDRTLAVVPQWWMPADAASVALAAPLARDGEDPAGRFLHLRIRYDQGAYLGPRQKDAIAAAMQRRPAALLLTIDHPSGEIFTYNVAQDDPAWPVPVVLVAPKEVPAIEAAAARGEPLALQVTGRHLRDVPGRNIVGRLDRGRPRTIVVSTPVSSWFTSSCERGPGIAAFLATARLAAERWTEVNWVFVATSGHEIGHGGMGHFLHDGAPPAAQVAAWLHYGASLACLGADGAPDNRAMRSVTLAGRVVPLVQAGFAPIAARRLEGAAANVGELREIMAAGYGDVFGMAGLHPWFHTPRDGAHLTSPALLEPVVQGFFRTLQAVHDLPAR